MEVRRAVLLIVAALWMLASGPLAKQGTTCPCPLIVSWALDPSHDAPGIAWESVTAGCSFSRGGNTVILVAFEPA